jgi:hypothetical protein
MTRARVVRWVVIGVCAVGIGGMIVGSVADNNDVALTFGLITAAAVLCLMVATAVAPPGPDRRGVDDEQAAHVEQLVERLVAQGAPETAVRELVGEAVRLGRGGPRSREIPHIAAPNADD